MSNYLNDKLKNNILLIWKIKKLSKSKLAISAGFSRSSIQRITSKKNKSLSLENLEKLAFFSSLTIEEMKYLSTDLLKVRMERRKEWKYNTYEELYWMTQEDIAKNWEADKELMK